MLVFISLHKIPFSIALIIPSQVEYLGCRINIFEKILANYLVFEFYLYIKSSLSTYESVNLRPLSNALQTFLSNLLNFFPLINGLMFSILNNKFAYYEIS